MKLKQFIFALVAMLSGFAFTANAQVAKVGNTEYATIDEAISNWTSGTTLTLLADVQLSGVVKINSNESRTLDLGTFTMTAAKNQDAFQYVVTGSTSDVGLSIKADATNPGGINASGKAIIRHTKPLFNAPSKDRPYTQFFGGVFNASYIVYQGGTLGAGYTGASAPRFVFHGGEFNGTIYANRSKIIFNGGTFNGNIQISVDSSADALVNGGKFKNLSNLFGSELNSDKFTIGSSAGVYDREVYVDENGYYVISASEPAEGIEADVAKTPGTNDYFAYSKVATDGQLGYTDVETALKNNTSATVTVYADEVDMTGINFSGTIIVPEGNDITITNAPSTLKVQLADGTVLTPDANGNVTTVLSVAQIGEQKYATLDEALEATKTMTGDVTVEILDKVTFNQPLIGSYSSINFVGKAENAEMYLDVQGYTTATGKKVSFTDLKLSKSEGGFIANAGFMNVAFGIYDVEEVTYTNCTFENGACASSGKVTFNGCTFKKSWDKYGLWAYGNVDVTVQGSTFADYRGIKMYAENGADASVEKANLTVKNTNFSAVNNKPAIVLTYGESVVLEGNTYSSTGTFELDLDGKPNGVAVTSDVAPVCVNDNGACGVLVDGKIYTTVAQAAEVATETSTVVLLHNSNETVEFPMGTTIDKNGFTADNVTTAQPFADYVVLPQDITVNNYKALFGTNTVTDGTNYYATLQAAVEAVAGQANAVLYCKPGADVGSLQHAPVVSTLTVYGNGANVTGGSERDFDLGNTDPSGGKDITADMTLTVKHLNGCGAWGAKATEHTVNLVFENCANMGKVFITGTTGTLNITMNDCAFEGIIKEAVYSNADGAITLNNVAFSNLNKAINLNHKAAGTQTVTINGCSFTDCGNDVAADQIPVRVVSSVEGGKSVLSVSNSTFSGTPTGGADILLDYGVGLTEATVASTTANVVVENENNVGTKTEVSEGNSYEFTTAKPVASINGTTYMTLAEAVAAAQNNETITLVSNIELAEVVTIPAGKTLTIDLNGKAISMKESIIATAYAINNLGNLTIKDGVGGGSVNARGMYNGYGNGGENVASATITILGGTFNAKGTNGGAAIFNYGTANVNGGKFTSIGGYSLNNQAGAEMNITDGVEVTGGIYNNQDAELTVDGGNISNNRSGCHTIYAWNAKVTVNGGSIHNENSGNATIMSAGTSEVTINGGTISIKDGRVPGDGNTWTSCLTDAANTAKIIVNGGTFNGGVRVQSGATMTINGGSFNDVYGSNYNIYGTVTVTGGTFTDDTAKTFASKHIAAGYELNADGTVVQVNYVAQIGETKYATLAAAVDAAQAGDVITLIENIETADGVVITDKNLTIDLNGKTYTVTEGASTNNRNFKINGASVVTVKNGTMVAAGEYSSGAYGTIRTEGTANVTLTGLKLYNYRGNGLNIKACAGTTVTIENTEIYANYGGGIEAAGGTIVVNDGVTVEQKGMYTAAYNSMAISVNGGGKVTVNGGTFSTECITAEEANNHGTSHGPWVAGVLNSGGTLIINGGTFSNDNFGENSLATAARGAILADTKAKVEINGGTFNVLKNVIDIQNNLGDVNNNPSVVLAGGTYNADPRISAQYGSNLITLADGYVCQANNDGTYGVELAPTDVKVATLAELQAALADNSNELPIIITTQIVIPEGTTVELDLNGKTVNSVFNGNSTTNHIYALSNKGTLTINDSKGNGSINSRGIYNYGSLTLNAGAINAIDGNGGYAVNNQNGSTFVMNGGVVAATCEDDHQSSSGGYDATALKVPAGCTATLNGGTINNVCDFTYAIDAAGTLNIPETSAITVNGTHGAIYVSGGETTINAGTFQIPADEYTRTDNVLYVSGGSLVVNGGTFIGDSDTASGGSCLSDAAGKAVVNGGTFKGSSGGDVWGTTGTTIKGGTFENLTEKQHIADGYELDENGTVVQVNYVAQIGETKYATLQAAIENVQEGETITVLEDITFTTGANGSTNGISYTRGASFTLDLNGKTITSNLGNNALRFKIGDGNSVVNTEVTIEIKNGKIVSGANNWCAISAATADNSGNKLILNLTDLAVEANKGGDFAVKSWAGAVVNANNVDVTANYAGGFYAVGGEIVLDENSSVAQKGLHTAPYMSYAFGVSSGTGKMTINGGIYSAVPAATADAYNQGASHGSSVGGVMSSGGTLIINGGTFSNDNFGDAAPTAPRALLMADAGAKVEIKGGTFNAMAKIVDPTNNTGDASKNAVVTIAGGTYSANPTDAPYNLVKLAEDYVAVENNGVWNVVKAAAKIGEQGYASLAEALAAAQANDVITLLDNVELASTVTVAGKAITLDLNGKTISGTCNAGQSSLVYIENNAALTVVDSSDAKDGKLTYAKGTSNVGWTVDVKGAFTLEAGTVELTGSDWSIGYAVDVRPNSWGTEYTKTSVFTMNGGKLVSSDGAVRVASSSAPAHKDVAASFVMNGGVIDAAWDGVFVQQSDVTYDVLSFTMNGGTIESDLNPVRVYGPAATGYVNGQECMNISFNGGTMTYTGTETREWVIDGILRVGGGSSMETILESGNITAGAEFVNNNTLPEGYEWVADGNGNYVAASIPKVAQIGETYYATLEDAVATANAVTDSQVTITLLADIDYSGDDITANVVLDLNGKTVTSTGSYFFWLDEGKLTVKDSSDEKTGKLYGVTTGNAILVYGNSTLVVEDVDIFSNNNVITTFDTNNTVTINGGKLEANSATQNSAALYLAGSESTVTINAGTIIGDIPFNYGTLVVKGGSYTKDVSGYCAAGYATALNSETGMYEIVAVTAENAAAKIGDRYFLTLNAALQAATVESTIVVLKDFEGNLESLKGTIVPAEGKTVTVNATNTGWYYLGSDFTIGEGVTFNMPDAAFFVYYTDEAVIKGKVTVNGLYIRYAGTRLTVEAPGALNVTGETFIIRDVEGDGAAGLYIVGDDNDETVELTAPVVYFYQGVINAKNANINVGTYWQTQETDASEFANAGAANLVLDNSVLNVTVPDHAAKATGNSTVTLKNGALLNTVNSFIGNAAITVDAAGITANTIVISGNVEDLTGEITLTGNDVATYAKTAEGLVVVIPKVAAIGETVYATLQAAVEAAQAGETVVVLENIELSTPVVVAADKELTLDLNGKTVSYTSAVVGEDMITNNGNLTIDSSVEGGKITYNNTDTTGKNVTISTISACPGSTLVVKGGTIENTSEGVSSNVNVAYAIDILTNGSLGNVAVTIDGGSVVSTKYIAIRQFNNGTACENRLTINGGHIYGAKRAVQVHLNNNAAVTAINGGKVEAGEGGYAICNYAATSDLAVTDGELIGAVYSANEGFITGGTFSEEPYSGYLADHYVAELGTDGRYNVDVEEGYIFELEIIDGEYGDYINDGDKTVGKLTYVRTLPAAGIWYPVFLPFDVPVASLAANFDVARINDLHTDFSEEDGSIKKMWIEYIVRKSGTLAAGKPFLVRAKSSEVLDMEIELENVTLYASSKKNSITVSSAITKVTFEGVYEATSGLVSTPSTRYMAVNANGVWDEFDGYALNPFRVMMTLEILDEEYYVASTASLSVGARVVGEENEDGTTTIYDVEADREENDMIFDLQGRRVLETEKGGIYIKNGKKFIVK
ncbi:MAG: hypothetical protein J6V23_02580 [Bacteroidaceae bacterium]|nr:hypothetical protein [Bacteroidaceae bacterium]